MGPVTSVWNQCKIDTVELFNSIAVNLVQHKVTIVPENKQKNQNPDRCSTVTFWKVAVLPCTGVLAPICSCWHSTTSFSVSVITTDFSSSTGWNSENETKTVGGKETERESEMSFRTAEIFCRKSGWMCEFTVQNKNSKKRKRLKWFRKSELPALNYQQQWITALFC